jgi:hypothetical protein
MAKNCSVRLVRAELLAIAVSAGLALPGLVAAQCGALILAPAKQQIESSAIVLVYAPSESPLPVGQHFSLQVQVCLKDPAARVMTLQVDADMPAHRHGMNYRPKVERLESGVFHAQGMMFHMPGTWRVMFEVLASDANGRVTRLDQTVQVQ